MQFSQRTRQLTKIVLLLYVLFLFWVIALKCNMPTPVFESKYIDKDTTLIERIVKYVPKASFETEWKDAIINVMLFMPLGALLPFLLKKRPYLYSALICLAVSYAFEFLQLVSCIGAYTYIDVIHNTAGGVIGALVHLAVRRYLKDKPLRVAYYVIIGILCAVLLYAKISTIINIEMYFAKY